VTVELELSRTFLFHYFLNFLERFMNLKLNSLNFKTMISSRYSL